MAKQVGLIKLRGSVGDMTYMDTKNGFRAQEKSSLDGDRIASDPDFKRTRENGREFGRACKAGKTLRLAFNILMKEAKDARVVTRLVKDMMVVLHTDPINRRGERTVGNGDISLLSGLEFNEQAVISTMLFVPYEFSIDRANGSSIITIPPFVPENAIVPPENATHFQFTSGLASINFDSEESDSGNILGEILPIDEQQAGEINLSVSIEPNSTFPLFLTLGICFHEKVNNFLYPLRNGTFNSLSVISIDIPK